MASLGQEVASAAKVLEQGDTTPKVLGEENSEVPQNVEAPAPPSTPTKEDSPAAKPEKPTKERRRSECYEKFPLFKVTWDPSVPSLMNLKSPGKKKRRNSHSTMIERPSVQMVQEMSPQATLVEFIVTSASYHGVRRQDLKNLEDDLFRVFRNNVMPANAAAWYMARRRFYMDPKETKQRSSNPLLPMLLKEYPKKFKIVDNVVHFLESYAPTVARTKMSYLVQQGLFAYFSHKADEHGVYFFDPLYYEETEPFHANLRVVTNLYNNQKTNKLINAFFKRYKKQFHYKQLSPYLAVISKHETEVVHGMTGIVVNMVDKNHGIIKFQRGAETNMALFSTNSLYLNGYRANVDPKSLPPVFFDAFKIPESDKFDKFKWFAVLTWTGRRPNPKFCSPKDELTNCSAYRQSWNNNETAAATAKKPESEFDYMKMGIVKEIRKNGAVAIVKNEDSDLEQKYFIPGWAFSVNSSRQKQLTTTQGIGLSVGDLVNFYIDPNSQAKPYDAVACNVDILKHADAPGVTKDKKVKPVKFGPQKKPPVSWYSFLMTEDLASDSDNAENDPTYEPPAEHEDVEDFDSDISLDEIQELAESLKVDIDSLALQYKAEDKVAVEPEKTESEKTEPEAAVNEDEPSKSEN
jgi:hypothetical protein